MTTSSYPVAITTNSTSSNFFNTYLLDATSGNLTFTLQNISSRNGITITMKRIDTSSNTVTIQGTSGQTINGSSTVLLGHSQEITVVSSGGQWRGMENGSGNVSSGVVLTTDKIVKGVGNNSVTTSGITIDSLNNLVIEKNSFTTTITSETLTANRTLTLSNNDATLVVTNPNMVTETGTNTSGNLMVTSGGKVIEDSGLAFNRLLRSDVGGINRIDSFFVSFNNSTFISTSPNFNITGAGWSSGTLTINVTDSGWNNPPKVIMQVGAGSSNPSTEYNLFLSTDTTTSLIKIFGCIGGSASNFNVCGIIYGF